MPWKIAKKDKQFCIYKENADGEPAGESLGCHDSHDKAEAQLAALYANEGKALAYLKADMSLDQMMSHVRDAWYQQFMEGGGDGPAESRGYIEDVYGDYVIARMDDGCFRIAYGKKADGEIEFAARDQWVEVERRWMEVGKATLTVKALTPDRIGGYALLWGDKERKDLTGEYFTPQTEEVTQIFDAMKALPYLYHHAMNGQIKASVIGKIDVFRPDDIGVWFEAELDKANQYKRAVLGLVEKQVLHSSSGTLPGARKVASDGKILRWPVAEVSGTPTPAEPRMMERPVSEIKAAYEAIGLAFPVGDAEGAVKARGEAVEIEREQLAWEALELEGV